MSERPQTAKVFSGIRDVPIFIGESSPGKRWVGGPWRPIEWAAIVAIGCPTWWIVVHAPPGTTLPVLLWGVGLLAAVIVGLRLLLPRHRPSLSSRTLFALNTVRPPRGVYGRPKRVTGNLVFTRAGTTAEYLCSSVSSPLDAEETHTAAAQTTRNLVRYLPSGSIIRGLFVPEDTDALMLALAGDHKRGSPWLAQCRAWEPILRHPTHAYDILNNIEWDETAELKVPARQRFWLSIPVDCGTSGRTRLGRVQQAWDWVKGRDKQSDESTAGYAATAEAIVNQLPAAFELTPATPEQIGWYWRHRATLGAVHEPMPTTGVWPDVLEAGDFPRIEYDEGDNARRPWWKPSRKPILRVSWGVDSYQTFLTVTHWPESGVGFPRSYYLHTLERIETAKPVAIEWMQHLIIRTPIDAERINRGKTKNIKDQRIQQGESAGRRLVNQLRRTAAYSRELESSPAEREVDHAVVIAVGAADQAALEDAVAKIRHELDTVGIVVERWTGAQAALSKAFFTGLEGEAPLDECRNPTTAHLWSLFLPFVGSWLGNAAGSPMAVDQTTARPSIIRHDPEGCARRNNLTGEAWVGEPGGGKSNAAKLGAAEVMLRGGRVVVFEPDLICEWGRAFKPFEHLGVRFIDPTTAKWCFDTLLMYPGEQGRRLSADHVLPWIGLPDNHIQAKRYRRLLRMEGPGDSHRALLAYLQAQPGADNDELLARLESAAEDFPPFFDDTLPVYRPDESAATIYLTGNLDLPDADEIANEHRFSQMKTQRRTGMAIYGLLVEIEQMFMFSRTRYDLMIFEEAAEMCSYPAGARIVHLITKRGRKHATGIWLICQDFRIIQRVNDCFIRQKHIFRITDRELAYETLKWAGFDVTSPWDALVTDLCENTSPPNKREHHTAYAEAGAVDPWRRGEGFGVGERGERYRCQYLQAPTREQADAFDSTPLLEAA